MDSATQRPRSTPRRRRINSADTEGTGREALEKILTRGLMPLARSWHHALDQELNGLGLSGTTGWTLMRIEQLGDEVRQTDLACGLDINSASVVRLVDMLVEAGLVCRFADTIDRRVRRVRLTERGREAAGRVENAVASFRRHILADLDEEDLGAAVRVSRKISQSLEAGRRV